MKEKVTFSKEAFIQKIILHLWFDKEAEEAAIFYMAGRISEQFS